MRFNVQTAAYDESGDGNPVVVICGTVDQHRVCAKLYYQTIMFAGTAGGNKAVKNVIAVSFVNVLIRDSNNPINAKTGGKQLTLPVYPPSKFLQAPLQGKNNTLSEALVGEWEQDVLVDNETTRKVADNLAWVMAQKPKGRRQ